MKIQENSIIGRLRCGRVAPLLVPYADDRLRRVERERVEAHLENCPACRAEVQTITSVSALLRDESLSAASPIAADPSPNLWAGIEAEIRRSGVPLDRSAESPLLRPRRRVGLGWDAAWPSSVPVAAAVFSAIVFGTVLLNHHALTAPTASGVTKGDDTITVAMRSSASFPALASLNTANTANTRPDAPGAALPSVDAPVSRARAEVVASAIHGVHTTAGGHRSMAAKGDLVAFLSRPLVVHNDDSVAAKPASNFFGIARVAPHHALPAASAPSVSGVTLADANTAGAPVHATASLGAENFPSNRDTARSPEVNDGSDAAAATKPTGNSLALAAAADDNVMPVSASKPADDDATVRSGAPADQSMADFAAMSRRQRNLFSYTSR